jgi:hypothetical protein
MTFRETLELHLDAIRGRDLSKLIETLPREELSLVTSDGRLVRTTSEFIEMHRGWFSESTWTLHAEVASLVESDDLGVALLRLDYRDEPPGRPPLREASFLCLVFARREGRWVMVHDQNTPIKERAEGAP